MIMDPHTIERLLALWKERSLLWNVKNKDYRKIYMKHTAWERIAEKMGE